MFNERDMVEFNEFIDSMGLVDVPSIGSRFIWENKEGSFGSILDKFFISEKLMDKWKIVGQVVDNRDISD